MGPPPLLITHTQLTEATPQTPEKEFARVCPLNHRSDAVLVLHATRGVMEVSKLHGNLMVHAFQQLIACLQLVLCFLLLLRTQRRVVRACVQSLILSICTRGRERVCVCVSCKCDTEIHCQTQKKKIRR